MLMLLRYGLSFSIPLLLILGSHELGHFFVLPALPTAFDRALTSYLRRSGHLHTFGAFIRIRARIATKAEALRRRHRRTDCGLRGLCCPSLIRRRGVVYGRRWSRWRGPGHAPTLLLYHPGHQPRALAAHRWCFTGRQPANALLDLHPFALAAWVGMLATALNLLPMGQLDGGHVLDAVAGRLHRRVARVDVDRRGACARLLLAGAGCSSASWSWW